MTLMEPPALDRTLSGLHVDALGFEAPFVIERLVDDRIVESAAEAEALFTEVKRYLVMSAVHTDVTVGMCSARVDEAWHAFILYTAEYANFCKHYFGHVVGHAPKNAPAGAVDSHSHRRELSLPAFCERYEELFGEMLPDVWFDTRNIAPARRVFNDAAGRMSVTQRGPSAELLDQHGEILLSANDIAHDALHFIASTGAFYVRELPGGLSDVEKVEIVEALMTIRALRLAP